MTRILFVDNDHAIRRFCKQELEAAGFEVVLAADGEEAVETFERVNVDLVVLDQHMPRCDGLQAAEHLHKRCPGLPIILFTADAYFTDFHTSPIDACISKSEDLTDLIITIDELLLERCELLPAGGYSA